MGRLRGHATGWQWAFLCAFVFDDLSRRSSAALHTLALFDLEKGEYGTSTEYDRPGLLRRRRAQRSSPSRGRLDLSFQGSRGESFWRAHEAGDGRIAPLGSLLRAVGADDDGRFMQLDLELDARKPALPLDDYAQPGAPSTGQPGARGYFQSGVRFSGELGWGDEREAVDGESGWIVRQWRPRFLRARGGFRRSRYQHELRNIQLEDGTAISVSMHFDRQRANRLMPPALATAAGPNGEVTSTTDFHLERLSFVRDP
ncbi:MAG: hypothetical protein ABW298_14420, partial [Candidatus Binatia bacterium]